MTMLQHFAQRFERRMHQQAQHPHYQSRSLKEMVLDRLAYRRDHLYAQNPELEYNNTRPGSTDSYETLLEQFPGDQFAALFASSPENDRRAIIDAIYDIGLDSVFAEINGDTAIERQTNRRGKLLEAPSQEEKWRFILSLINQAYDMGLDETDIEYQSLMLIQLATFERGVGQSHMGEANRLRHNAALHSIHVISKIHQLFIEVEQDLHALNPDDLDEQLADLRYLKRQYMRTALSHDQGELRGELSVAGERVNLTSEAKEEFEINRSKREKAVFVQETRWYARFLALRQWAEQYPDRVEALGLSREQIKCLETLDQDVLTYHKQFVVLRGYHHDLYDKIDAVKEAALNAFKEGRIEEAQFLVDQEKELVEELTQFETETDYWDIARERDKQVKRLYEEITKLEDERSQKDSYFQPHLSQIFASYYTKQEAYIRDFDRAENPEQFLSRLHKIVERIQSQEDFDRFAHTEGATSLRTMPGYAKNPQISYYQWKIMYILEPFLGNPKRQDMGESLRDLAEGSENLLNRLLYNRMIDKVKNVTERVTNQTPDNIIWNQQIVDNLVTGTAIDQEMGGRVIRFDQALDEQGQKLEHSGDRMLVVKARSLRDQLDNIATPINIAA